MWLALKKTKERKNKRNIVLFCSFNILSSNASFPFSWKIYPNTQISLFCLFISSLHSFHVYMCLRKQCDPGKHLRKQKICWLWRKKNKDEGCLEMRMNESDGKRKNNRDQWAEKFHYFALNRDRRIGQRETPLKNLSSI